RPLLPEVAVAPNARHEPRASACRLHAPARRNCGQIYAQRPCPISICRPASEVPPPKVVVERVLAGLETRGGVAAAPYAAVGESASSRYHIAERDVSAAARPSRRGLHAFVRRRLDSTARFICSIESFRPPQLSTSDSRS